MAKRRRLDDEEVADGETISVRMEMMDRWQKDVARWAAERRDAVRQHQPHFIDSNSPAVLDAKRKAVEARDRWLARQSNAWRGSTNVPTGNVCKDARASRLAWIDRATNAWKTPTPVRENAAYLRPQTPTRRALWGAMQQMGAKVDAPSDLPDPAAVQARRDAQFAQRCQDLENAWRSPAAAANEIERQRRAVTNEDHRR
jgi:hypothetical protein